MKKPHKHHCTSNTKEVYETFRGCTLAGVFHRNGTDHVEHWLIFNCGFALVQLSNGSCWTEDPESVSRELGRVAEQYDSIKANLENVLRLAGKKVGR